MTRRLIKDPSLSTGEIAEDGRILAAYYGYLAGRADSRAIATVVKRYYALAAAGNARAACSMIAPNVVRSLPITYDRGPGAVRSRKASSCEAIVARIFERNRAELRAPIHLTGVLTRGANGYALFDSASAPPSIASVVRARGAWMVASPLGAPIPVAK